MGNSKYLKKFLRKKSHFLWDFLVEKLSHKKWEILLILKKMGQMGGGGRKCRHQSKKHVIFFHSLNYIKKKKVIKQK